MNQRLSRDAEIMLKELAIAGHEPVGDPFVVPGYSVYRFKVKGFEWGLIYSGKDWVVMTSPIRRSQHSQPKVKKFITKHTKKPETALRHFIKWWMEYDILHGEGY
jgi:hypothetical protein